MLSRNCTRFSLNFSLVHDEPQKRFEHARSLFLRTNAFFIYKRKKNLYQKLRYDFYIRCMRPPQFLRVGFCTLKGFLYAGIYGK